MQEIIKENLVYEKEELAVIFKMSIDQYYKNKPFITYYLFIAVVLFGAGSTFIGNDIEKGDAFNQWGLICVMCSIFLLYLHFTEKKRISKRAAREYVKDPKPSKYIMNINGLCEILPGSQKFYNWDNYFYYVIKDGIILLFENKNIRMFSSKHYTKEEWGLLIEWISSKVKPFRSSLN